jgi:hypothetical protein
MFPFPVKVLFLAKVAQKISDTLLGFRIRFEVYFAFSSKEHSIKKLPQSHKLDRF